MVTVDDVMDKNNWRRLIHDTREMVIEELKATATKIRSDALLYAVWKFRCVCWKCLSCCMRVVEP